MPSMSKPIPLSINGLAMPGDFPVAALESIHSRAFALRGTHAEIYEHFASAWNAVAYRFLAVAEYEIEFTASLSIHSADATLRHQQEKQLFGFFSNGFSVFEAAFYGLFSLGSLQSPSEFPIATSKDQQRISPSTTMSALKLAFPSSPLNAALNSITNDPAYLEWREIRNVLTHRAAPGRRFHAHLGGKDFSIPDQWKLKDISLDVDMAPTKRAHLSRLLNRFADEVDVFAQAQF